MYANYNYTCARSASKCRYLRRLYADFMRYYCARIEKGGQTTTEPPRPLGIIPEFYPLGMGLEIGKNWLGFLRNAKMRFPAEFGRYGGIKNRCNYRIFEKSFLKKSASNFEKIKSEISKENPRVGGVQKTMVLKIFTQFE